MVRPRTILLVGGTLAAGIVGAVALGGSAKAGEPHYDGKLVPPETEDEIREAKTALCTLLDGWADFNRDRDYRDLVARALKKVYSNIDIPWGVFVERYREGVEPVAGDHPSVAKVVKKFRAWANELLGKQGQQERRQWCGEAEPPDEDDELPPDEDEDEPSPDEDDEDDEPGETPQQKRKRIFDSLVSEKYEGGKFRLIEQGDSGIERAAWWALHNAGVVEPSNYYQRLVLPLMKALSRGRKWNRRLYDGPSDGYWAVDGRSIGYAWNPRHAQVRPAVLEGKFPERTITANGNKISGSGGSQYGFIWMPKFDKQEAVDNQTFVLLEGGEDPPEKFLKLLK